MTDEMMSLRVLLEKSSDADFLREMISSAIAGRTAPR
jgi:hypothetical protein